MLTIEKLDTYNKSHVRRFVEVPFQFYKNTPQWVPPIRMDVAGAMDRKKHPFYEHSEADFFIAVRDGKDVGRIQALSNRKYNEYHGYRRAQFYYYECEDNQETANALFERAFDWARERQLDEVVGPKSMFILDGYGLLVEGFEHRQMMTMMNYNHPYLVRQLEALGFEKEVDFVSCYVHTPEFKMDDRIHRIAERTVERGTFSVIRFKNKRELVQLAPKIGQAYNKAFVNNWEYAPLSDREVKFVVDTIITVADHRLFKIIMHGDDVAGFLLAFPDVSKALQSCQGKLFPFGIVQLLMEMRRTNWLSVNGAGVLPEFQGRGGNALMYSELEKTARQSGKFEHIEMTQVAESAVQMRSDLENLGGKAYKNHRVFHKKI